MCPDNLLRAHGIQFSIHGILPWRVFQEEIVSLLWKIALGKATIALGKATLVLYDVTNERLCLYISLPILKKKKKKSPYFTDLYVVTNERLRLLCEVSPEYVLYIVYIGKRSPTHVFYTLRTHTFLN